MQALHDEVLIVEGHFSLFVVGENGQRDLHYQKKNMIVNGARKIMSHAIVPNDEPFAGINRFRLGGNNTIAAAEYLTPMLPERTDIELRYTDNLFERDYGDQAADLTDLFTFSHPNAPNETSVLFEIQIERTEAHDGVNPSVYSCAGLYSYADGVSTLFSSQSFPAVILGGSGATRSLIINWEISF